MSSEITEVHVPDEVHEPKSSTSPLLSEEGKDFLAGRIDAREYVERARRDAAVQVRREFDEDVVRGSLRRSSSPILFLGVLAYAIFGIVSFVRDSFAVGITAVITAAALGLPLFFFLVHNNKSPG